MTQWFFGRSLFSRRKEKIEITVETKESWGVRWFRESRTEVCPVCRAETIFIPTELASQLVQADDAAITRLLESEQIHFSETADGEKLICLSALKKAVAQSSTQEVLKDE